MYQAKVGKGKTANFLKREFMHDVTKLIIPFEPSLTLFLYSNLHALQISRYARIINYRVPTGI